MATTVSALSMTMQPSIANAHPELLLVTPVMVALAVAFEASAVAPRVLTALPTVPPLLLSSLAPVRPVR